MKNNAIKKGIEEYFEKQASETHNGNGNNNPKIIDITTQLESVKKKVKKADLPINFQDDESYKFENLGGISETLK